MSSRQPASRRADPRTARSSLRLAARGSLLAAVAAAAVPTFTRAQPATPLEDVVVTATRTPTRVDDALAEVTVVDRQQLDAYAGRTLTEVLSRQPGVQFSSNGGLGKSSSVSLRGLESRHVLLLIDGVRYGSATLGTPSWENLPLDAIERIEIVRGPLSSLYGSDAVGGVVQIFTRRGAPGLHGEGIVALGTDAFRQVGAGLRFGEGAFDGALRIGHQRTHGFSTTNERVPFDNHNPDDDGFKQSNASARLGWRFANDWRLEALGLFSDGETHFDDGLGADARAGMKTQVVSLQASGKLLAAWTTSLRVARSEDEYDTKASASPFTDLGTIGNVQEQLTFENTIATAAGDVLLLAEHLKQKVSRPGAPFEVSNRSINGFGAGLNGRAGAHGWQASLRHDRNSQFGSQTTGALAYAYDLSRAWRLGASYGTSFVAPSFNQLYYPGFGNPELQPEEGKHAELSVRWAITDHQVRLAWFDNRIRGFIPSGPRPANVPRARVDGLGLSYEGQLAGWALAASTEHLDPRVDEGAANVGNQLPRRARKTARLSADSPQWNGWSVGAGLNAVGARYDDAANTRRLGGYGVVDLNADWRFAPAWALGLKLNNLTGRDYETVYGYNQPGREVFVSLRYNGGR